MAACGIEIPDRCTTEPTIHSQSETAYLRLKILFKHINHVKSESTYTQTQIGHKTAPDYSFARVLE